MDLVIFEENKPFVLEGLRDGEFDYMEAASEVFEADFFRFIKAGAYLDSLAETYPIPRKKEEVPFWFYVASNLSMRLHGVHAFDAFPMVVRCGGMLQALGQVYFYRYRAITAPPFSSAAEGIPRIARLTSILLLFFVFKYQPTLKRRTGSP